MSTESLHIDRSNAVLRRRGARFDPWRLRWVDDAAPLSQSEPTDPAAAVAWLFGGAVRIRRVPVGVIGPRTATPEQYALAETLGHRLGRLGLTVLCGGRGGVMEAVCKGCLAADGTPIGLLPDDEWDAANDYVVIPLASGLGPARNAIIARACSALIAIGGGHGTLSEIAFGLHFDRLVLTLADAPEVPGALHQPDIEATIDVLCRHILRLG